MGMKPEIKTDAECVRFCVSKRGGRHMLQTKNQSLQARCPGSGGRMGGTKSETGGALDPKTYMIAVEKIEAEAASRGSSTRPN